MKEKQDIILSVQTRPALWDRRHKHHHNRHVLDREWKEVARELKSTDKIVKQIWKNLRQEFKKQFIRCSESAAAGVPEIPTWKYYESMMFLHDQIHPPSANISLPEADGMDYNDDEATVSVEDDDSSYLQLDTENFPMLTTDDSLQLQESLGASPATTSTTMTRAGFRKRIISQAAIGQQLMQLEHEILKLKQGRAEANKSDEDVGFFNSLLPHVKTLSPRNKMLFRMKVQQTLFEMAYPEPT